MMTALYRMITWTEHYGMSKEEISDLLNHLANDSSIAEAEDSGRLETAMREIVPDPCWRAQMFCNLMKLESATTTSSGGLQIAL